MQKKKTMITGFLLLILLDQISKYIAQTYLGGRVVLLNGGFGFNYVEYYRTHFFRLISYGVVVNAIISVITLFIIYFIYRLFVSECPRQNIFRTAFIFIFGGWLGNLFDKLIYGTCGRDFITFPSLGVEKVLGKGRNTNLADIFIIAGIILIFIPIIINPEARKKFWHYKAKDIAFFCKREIQRLIYSFKKILKSR